MYSQNISYIFQIMLKFPERTHQGLAHLVIWERSQQKYKLLDQFGTCTVNRQGQCTITVHIGMYIVCNKSDSVSNSDHFERMLFG